MLTKSKRPETLDTALTVKGQGISVRFHVVYNNRSQQEVSDFLPTMEKLSDYFFFLVKSMETDYQFTPDGLVEMESDFPGVTQAIIDGFYKARMVEAEKN